MPMAGRWLALERSAPPPNCSIRARRWSVCCIGACSRARRNPCPERITVPGRFAGRHVEQALVGKPDAAWFRVGNSGRVVLAAAAPIGGRDAPLGAVVLEQTGERLLTLRDNALVRLLNLTLIATALAVAGTLGFAGWLSLRVVRIRRAAETALSPDGQPQRGLSRHAGPR